MCAASPDTSFFCGYTGVSQSKTNKNEASERGVPALLRPRQILSPRRWNKIVPRVLNDKITPVTLMEIEYKIIGGDGVEYGPAPLSELKSWIRDGRVAGMTKVWRSDLSIWSPADRYTELLEELSRLHARVTMAADSLSAPAGFWARLAAYIIDHILLAVIFFAIWTPIANEHHWQMPAPPQVLTDASFRQYVEQCVTWMDKTAPLFYPMFLFVFLIYEVFLNGRFGATLGKMAIGAKITMVDGAPIGYGRALLRWFAARLCEFLLFFAGDYLFIALRQDKRAAHDLLAGTKVVFKR